MSTTNNQGLSVSSDARERREADAAPEEKPSDPADLQALVAELYPEGLPAGVIDDFISERRSWSH